VTIGFVPETSSRRLPTLGSRTLEPAEWTGIQRFRCWPTPRDVIKDLHARHLPSPSTAVIAVYDPDGRIRASASFNRPPAESWTAGSGRKRASCSTCAPRAPARPAAAQARTQPPVLMVCREGAPGWDRGGRRVGCGGLRDACTPARPAPPGRTSLSTGDGWKRDRRQTAPGAHTPTRRSLVAAGRRRGRGPARSPEGTPQAPAPARVAALIVRRWRWRPSRKLILAGSPHTISSTPARGECARQSPGHRLVAGPPLTATTHDRSPGGPVRRRCRRRRTSSAASCCDQ